MAAKIVYKPVKLLDKKKVEKFIEVITPGKSLRLSVKFPCDLRASLKMKAEEASKFSWTAFVNRAGTLAHIMYYDDELLIRIPLKPSINSYSTERMHRILIDRIQTRLNFIE